jgi:predicted nucleotidyltransferase
MESRDRLSAAEARQAAERGARLLAEEPRVLLVYVFGSTVQPGRRAVRDVDLAVLADPPLSLDELLKRRADLAAATGAPIDLVSLSDSPIVLSHEVVEGGICLYARAPETETEFVTRTRARYWDFKPYREAQWQLGGERLAERQRGS